jgi:hypothetical protein
LAYVAWSLRLLDRALVLEKHVRTAATQEPHLHEDKVAALQYLLDAIDEVRAHFPELTGLLGDDQQ